MLIDLSHKLVSNMPVYPGDSILHVQQSAWVEKEGYAHFDLTIGVHAGTHMDGPAHMVAGGRKLCDFAPDRFITTAKILHKRDAQEITLLDVELLNLKPGDALLVRTDFSSHFNDPEYFTSYPVLTEEAAHSLVEKGIGLLGIDWPSPDTDPFRVHKILLGAEVLIIENLTNLATLGDHTECRLYALPMKVDADSAPVRVIAEI